MQIFWIVEYFFIFLFTATLALVCVFLCILYAFIIYSKVLERGIFGYPHLRSIRKKIALNLLMAIFNEIFPDVCITFSSRLGIRHPMLLGRYKMLQTFYYNFIQLLSNFILSLVLRYIYVQANTCLTTRYHLPNFLNFNWILFIGGLFYVCFIQGRWDNGGV